MAVLSWNRKHWQQASCKKVHIERFCFLQVEIAVQILAFHCLPIWLRLPCVILLKITRVRIVCSARLLVGDKLKSKRKRNIESQCLFRRLDIVSPFFARLSFCLRRSWISSCIFFICFWYSSLGISCLRCQSWKICLKWSNSFSPKSWVALSGKVVKNLISRIRWAKQNCWNSLEYLM